VSTAASFRERIERYWGAPAVERGRFASTKMICEPGGVGLHGGDRHRRGGEKAGIAARASMVSRQCEKHARFSP